MRCRVARPWRAQARDHCACAREDPIRKAVRWQKFYVLQQCFQHHVGGVPLAESKQTCQSTCSPPHGSRSAGMVGVVLGYDRVATAAAGFKGKVPFDIDF